ARCNLEDFTGSVECVMWPDDLARHKDDVREERICFVKGSIDGRSTREQPSLILTRILSIEQAQRELTRGLWLALTLGGHGVGVIDALARILRRTPGPCPVFLAVRDAAGKGIRFRLGDDFRVNPSTVAVADLETLLGRGCVKFAGVAGARNGQANGPTARARPPPPAPCTVAG